MIDEGLDGSVAQPMDQQIVEESPAVQEKMIPASQVNAIVQRRIHETAEKTKREMSQQMQSQQQQMPPMQQQQSSYDPNNLQSMIDERIAQQAEEYRKQAENDMQKQHAQQAAQEFDSKLQLGKEKYADFETVVKYEDMLNYPDIVRLANLVDNTSDVMYELMSNPIKMGSLAVIAGRSPQMAAKEMQKLSESIKRNEQAMSQKSPSAPLPTIKSSNASGDNGRPASVRDFKRASYLKG